MSKSKRSLPGSFGIAEWYGKLYRSLNESDRSDILEKQSSGAAIPCRYKHDAPALAPQGRLNCTKPGGVCSIRNFIDSDGGVEFGPITSTCPHRFLEGGTIVREIGNALLGTETPHVAREVPFLKRVNIGSTKNVPKASAPPSTSTRPDADFSKDDVGKIDMVCVHPDRDPLEWCAVEMQAVYFSGGKIEKDFEAIRRYKGNGIPLPGAKRRPDFRSSGPKRLMPQLQTKVPTLSRWGKKTAVVVDRSFFDSLGSIEPAPDASNGDIAWIILDYDEDILTNKAKLHLAEIRYCTLENAVKGLTAGVPTTRDEFEKRLREKVKIGN